MKVAIVTAFPPSKVTLNEYAFHLTKAFALNSDVEEITLLTDHVEDVENIPAINDGCKVNVVPCWKFNSYHNIATVSKAVKNAKADVVLFNLQFLKFGDKKIPAALGLMLPWICRMQGTPSMVLLHNIMEEVDLNNAGIESNKLMEWTYKMIGKGLTRMILQANKVAVTIHKYQETLEKVYGVNNVVTIPHGTFELPTETPNFKEPEEKLQVMAFGKFGTYKKVESMIEAVELVKKRTGKAIETVIAGTDNPNVKGYLNNVAEQYKYVSDLKFTGYVEEEDVPLIFKSSTLVCFPYTSTTGSSGVLHQAGSYGKAVVMPEIGDLSRLITDEGYQGAFFQPEDVSSLADAIEKVLMDPTYRIEMAKTNFKAATAYPLSKISEMYVDNFKEFTSVQQMSKALAA
ncbi:MAG: glycosyltransferase [Nonlabens sp.]